MRRGTFRSTRLSEAMDRKLRRPPTKAASEVVPSVVYQEAITRRGGRDASAGSGKEAGNVAAGAEFCRREIDRASLPSLPPGFVF
jgi:hypothetical protein